MVSGWHESAGGRHHGAHGGTTARALGVPGRRFVDFSQNINPLGTPGAALIEARGALENSSDRYPDLDYHELREALGAYLGVAPETVVPTNGGAEALFLAARVAGERRPGEGALILEPTFSEYAAAARTAGLEPVRRVSRSPEDGFVLDPGFLEDLDGLAAVFLCNPNNPTGGGLSREEVRGIFRRVCEAGAVLVVDEAFADFTPEVSVALETERGLLVARSFTKFFAVPGLRLGCLVTAEPDLARSFQPSWSVNVAAQAAGIAAAGDASFVEESLSETARLREQMSSRLQALPGLMVYPGSANFLLVRGPVGLVERLARRGVLVRGCAPFMGLGEEYFRVAVRPEDEILLLISAMEELF